MDNQIIAFQNKKIRRQWDEKEEKWYFSVIDVVEVLAQTDRPFSTILANFVYTEPTEMCCIKFTVI